MLLYLYKMTPWNIWDIFYFFALCYPSWKYFHLFLKSVGFIFQDFRLHQMLVNLFHVLLLMIFEEIACFFLKHLARDLLVLGFLRLLLRRIFAEVLCLYHARVPWDLRCRFLIRVLFSLLDIQNILFSLDILCIFSDTCFLSLLEFCRFLIWNILFALSFILCFALFIVKNYFYRHHLLQLDLTIMMKKIW